MPVVVTRPILQRRFFASARKNFSHVTRLHYLQSSPADIRHALALHTLNARHKARDGSITSNFRRNFSIGAVPTVLLPPLAFVGFFLALWTYKCCMMVLFQNKIIYMPGLPPGSRQEQIADYQSFYRGVSWEEKHIKSLDGTDIALCVGSLRPHAMQQENDVSSNVVILYFQGYGLQSFPLGAPKFFSFLILTCKSNGASLPPRLPGLSVILSELGKRQSGNSMNTRFTIVALSYRGYWTSRGRPSQSGIEKDATAALEWVNKTYGETPGHRVILWGQSLGAGVATGCLKTYMSTMRDRPNDHAHINGLILETPFLSIRSMLTALYPQKWLPYRYLWPFLWSWWDSEAALRDMDSASPAVKSIPLMIVTADKDEIVPEDQAKRLLSLCRELGMEVESQSVAGALHTEAMARQQGRKIVVDFIRSIAEKK